MEWNRPHNSTCISSLGYQSFADSALAAMRMGMSGVGVFPEREEILIRGARLSAVALQGVGAGKSQSRQCAHGARRR
jgi:hypothetical protein